MNSRKGGEKGGGREKEKKEIKAMELTNKQYKEMDKSITHTMQNIAHNIQMAD